MVNPNEDTEFNDALRARGILPPKPPSREPSPDIPHITHQDAVQAIAATADTQQLSLLMEADNLDSDDERMFDDYRRKRMAELRKDEKKGRFGSMEPLAREDFVKEVTEGSKLNAEGLAEVEEEFSDDDEAQQAQASSMKGTGVVVFLFKDSVPLAQHLRPILARVAAAHPSTKFLSIPAGLCIPNYPDKNVPTLLIYRNGEMVGNIVSGMGLNGMKTTAQGTLFFTTPSRDKLMIDVERLLMRYRAVEKPNPILRNRGVDDESDDDDGERGTGMVNVNRTGLRTGGTGTGAGKGDSDDSDFDL